MDSGATRRSLLRLGTGPARIQREENMKKNRSTRPRDKKKAGINKKAAQPAAKRVADLSSGIVTDYDTEWRSEADQRVERQRKGDLVVEVRGRDGAPIKDARVEYRLVRHAFLFGTAIAYTPFTDASEAGRHYRQFILDHFSALVCENEMKWYANEVERGHEDFAAADALLAFAEENELAMRGHCLFWDAQEWIQPWLAALDQSELRAAMERRAAASVSRYAGRLASWDVNNEMLDGSFYGKRLGPDAGAWTFREAARLDPKTPLFVNEYGILGEAERIERYLALIRDLRARGAQVGGIGIQSHDCDRLTVDGVTTLAPGERPWYLYTRPLTPAAFLGTLDRLHVETGLPIHLTEISAKFPDAARRGELLEMLFRLGFSHEAVEAIMLWGFSANTHWMGPDAALTNADGTLNAAGARISRLLREEWTTRGSATTGADGRVAFRGFYGRYALKVTAPDGHQIAQEVQLTKSAPAAVVEPTE
jgi:GH35 family endo-1,4-beta-xylanase